MKPLILLLFFNSFFAANLWADEKKLTLRPPAVPLVACDPYFSVWSCADRLTDDTTRHWTGTKQSLSSMIRIDGKVYRLMGDEPKTALALPQKKLEVLPTRTIYDFEGASVHVKLTFMTPALPDDLDALSRPLTYLTWDVRAIDGREHAVSILFMASAELTVNESSQKVVWSRPQLLSPKWELSDLVVLKIGSEKQPLLQKKGDNLRIDWGYLYVAAREQGTTAAVDHANTCPVGFGLSGQVDPVDLKQQPATVRDEQPVAAFALDLGKVRDQKSAHVLLAYDDEYSVTYFGQKLRPYWRRKGAVAADLIRQAEKDYETLKDRCEAFDTELMADLTKVGGEEYALIAALAYRQCLAANKLVADANGQPLLFPKENFSNGCIATVDVIYPMDPFFLLLSPTLAKASVVPVLNYAASPRWKFPFAPHDLGTYPIANGQVYGGGEKTETDQMPVEESGNMLLLLAAIAQIDGHADFVKPYWPQVTQWARYLEDKGFDPENQLCTDDFAGHLAHNVNLSAKAIEALGAYAKLCGMRGDKDNESKYRKLAEDMARKWIATADDGDHFRLAFDRKNTWSQKYNLAWDRILDLNLFPPEVIRKEMAFYLKKQNPYGLPLDNRKAYTKLDWIVWTATMAESQKDFDALISPVFRFLNETTDRVPMTDWFWTDKPRKEGFQARSVVGGVFMKMLANKEMWSKWASRDKHVAGSWAPLPTPPPIKSLVPDARHQPIPWRYIVQKPPDDWYKSDFDAGAWKEGPAGFGTKGTPGAIVRTEWKTDDIWLRREFDFPENKSGDLQFQVHHDEDVEVYLNGVLAASAKGYTTDYELLPIRPAALKVLKSGKNVLAVHCHQTTGGQYIDVGIVAVVDERDKSKSEKDEEE
jgi:Domain of unknown function (DUF4965)/Domain of unknown function (DUF5127)/Domain of unknown function (DUF1793)/Domain of unknown function (DUF4964)